MDILQNFAGSFTPSDLLDSVEPCFIFVLMNEFSLMNHIND